MEGRRSGASFGTHPSARRPRLQAGKRVRERSARLRLGVLGRCGSCAGSVYSAGRTKWPGGIARPSCCQFRPTRSSGWSEILLGKRGRSRALRLERRGRHRDLRCRRRQALMTRAARRSSPDDCSGVLRRRSRRSPDARPVRGRRGRELPTPGARASTGGARASEVPVSAVLRHNRCHPTEGA